MKFREFIASQDDDDRRLDRIIRKFISEDSLSAVYKSIRKGLIKINDKKAEASQHVFCGDKIKIADFLLISNNEKSLDEDKIDFNLEIVFKTDDLIFINKPYDIAVQGNSEALNRQFELFYKKNYENTSLSFNPGPLHRLDRKTTGLIAFSLSLKGAKWFSKNIADHTIQKKYIGVIQGKLSHEECWQDSISKEFDETADFQTVKINSSYNGKTAKTTVIPLGFGKFNKTEYTLAQFNIETGRTHQIRAQSSFHGYPLLGDTAYGGLKIQETEYFLHAFEMIFPENNELNLPPSLKAPVPKLFFNFLKSTMHDYEKCIILKV